jgi:trk system potassium uptake protein TrkA
MIWGRSSLAVSLVHGLEQLGVSVKIIVPQDDNVEELVDQCRTALVLRGDGKDQDLLIEENIQSCDAFFAVTPDEEDNILSSLLAKKLGCRMAVALVNKATYLPLVTAIGVDIVISSRLAAASAIFQHLHSDKFVSEISLRNLGGGFIEVILKKEMPLTGKRVKAIELPRGILFAAVIHANEVVIPSGETVLAEDDHLVIFVTTAASSKLEKLLGMKLEFFI